MQNRLESMDVNSSVVESPSRLPVEVVSDFLLDNKIWCHAKTNEALFELNKINAHYFWHQDDKFTITSKGYIWTYPGNVVGNNSVIVDNEKKVSDYKCYGVCSDYIEMYK